ncbi:hypothetical protein SALBM311S_00438 [Streptomyces alboniger]
MVAAYHYGGRGGEITHAWGSSPDKQFPTLHTYFAYGCLGVQVFFVISGFVICMSGWPALKSFFASRASRLLPAYWAAVLLVTAVFALPMVTYKALSPSDTLVNLTMLQYPLGVDRVLGVCWTLWAEVRFYALFALCVVLPGASRRRVIMFCAGLGPSRRRSPRARTSRCSTSCSCRSSPFFIGGVGLYLVDRDRKDVYAWGIVAVSFLIGQHYAVRSLWNAADPNAFAHRTSLGAGSWARSCGTGRRRPCWTPTRRSGVPSPRGCSDCRRACTGQTRRGGATRQLGLGYRESSSRGRSGGRRRTWRR